MDLDSTVCHTEHRAKLIAEDRSQTDWEAYAMACADDGDGPAMDLLRVFISQGIRVVFTTRRDVAARELTQVWFSYRGLWYPEDYDLLMLKDEYSNEERDQAAWKVRALRDYERRTGNEILIHVDDNPSVIEAMDKEGIPTLLVTPDYVSEYAKGQ